MKIKLNKNTLTLLRIPFSFFLMPIFILAFSQSTNYDFFSALTSFLIIHLLVYPASNGYNSYVDRDETSIGGLEKPPMPTKELFYLTLAMDFVSIFLSVLLVAKLFALCILIYILVSRAYSSRQIRLKKYPILGFLIVVIFQGAFTFLMSTIGITNSAFLFSNENKFILLACSLQIAGAYPLTQIYQHNADFKDGVTTLSYKLGYNGTFLFTAIMFGICNVFYFLYFHSINQQNHFYIIQAFFIPIVSFFTWWFYKTYKNNSEANFKNTMLMNKIAAICMNGCFITLTFLN